MPSLSIPNLSMGLALSKNGNGCLRLPLGISPREAGVKIFGIGPLHNFLEKGWSEPEWIEKTRYILSRNS
jgi:hypothetical protein